MIINRFTPNLEVFKTDIINDKVYRNETKKNKNIFSGVLKKSLEEINNKQVQAEKSQEAFIRGENIDIHNVMLAGAEAKLSLQFAVEARNKILDAYQEINRMQL